MLKATDKKRLVLIDAHALIHRAYHALPDFSTSSGMPSGALYGLSSMIVRAISELKPDYLVAAYDLPGKTFRHEAYDNYKGTRAKTDDALIVQLQESRNIFKAFGVPIYDAPGFEADDILGTIVEKMKKEKNLDIIIVSGDMDTLQLVDDKRVQVFTLKKGLNDTVSYDEEAVLARFGFKPAQLPDYKGLRGDTSDNIIGVKGIGEKTAQILIENFGTIEGLYKTLEKGDEKFRAAGITPRIIELLRENKEEAEFSKTLATIRRDAPIQFTLPEEFKEGFSLERATKILEQYEFRSLIPRVRALVGAPVEKKETLFEEKTEKVSPTDLLETGVAMWLIDSERTNPSVEDILEYTKKKSWAEARAEVFSRLEKDTKAKSVYDYIERPIMPLVMGMEKTGVLIDQPFFKKLSEDYHAKLDALTKKIYKLAGEEFNINSPAQLGKILFEKLNLHSGKKTSGGARSTKISVLEELEDQHEIIGEIMQYRELQKLLSTYIDVIPKLIAPDGRLHAQFIQHGSTTGRFSCNNPNLQNIPIRTEQGKAIRQAFVAPKGSVLISLDYSQIELRVMAMLSGDPTLLGIFASGKDVHSGVAASVFGVAEKDVTSDMRRKAKVINFGIIYGMGILALKKNLGTTREEAQSFYDNYFLTFPAVKNYMESVKEFAREHGYTETFYGRRRYFKDIKSKLPYLRAMAERMATNAPVQGTAADILKLALAQAHIDLAHAGFADSVKLIMQIHDELVYECLEKDAEEVLAIIKSSMEEVLSRSYVPVERPVALQANGSYGKSLGDV